VADHINHFTNSSMKTALIMSGYDLVEIDDTTHRGAFIAIARWAGSLPNQLERAEPLDLSAVSSLSHYWTNFPDQVRSFESQLPQNGSAAIYGSGFYGSLIETCLERPERIQCFLDRDPFRWKKTVRSKAILSPEELPRDISVVYVGLNPENASTEFSKVDCWNDRQLKVFHPASIPTIDLASIPTRLV
jgi:diamine N-acetyltransferase